MNPRRVGLNTADGAPSTGGGAAVTAGVTPSVGQRASAAREILSGGPSSGQQIVGGLRTGVSAAEKLASLFPEDTTRGGDSGISLPDRLRSGEGLSGAAASATRPGDAARIFFDERFPGLEFPTTGAVEGVSTFLNPASQVSGGELALGAEVGGQAGDLSALQSLQPIIAEASEFLPVVGTALGIAGNAMSGQSPTMQAIEDAVLVAGAAAAPFTFGISAVVAGIVDAVLGMTNKPELSHKQREEISTGKILQGAGTEAGALKNAKTLPDLWKAVVDMQSGSVGGKDDPATVMNLPLKSNQLQAAIDAGAVSLPTRYGKDASRYLQEHPGETLNIFPGNENATYPVWTQQGFFNALRQNPRGLKAMIQGGVAPENLAQGDQALSNTLLRAYQRLQVPPPEGAMPAMPPPPPVNVGGPSEALGFTQDVVQNAP